MKIEIVKLDKNVTGTGTVMVAEITGELEVPELPSNEHEKEWKEFWKHKKDAILLHLGTAELEQTELTEEQIKE